MLLTHCLRKYRQHYKELCLKYSPATEINYIEINNNEKCL